VQEEPVNQPPSAAFKVPVCTAAVPCRFSDRSTDTDGNITGRNWVLGNGTESSESSPSITYARVGTYDVTLTVTDDEGATSSVTRQVRVTRGTLSNTEPIHLRATTYVQSNRQYVSLSWANMNGDMVAVYWNGNLREHTRNDRKLIRSYATRGPRIFTYRLCETGTSRCSNTVTASIN
jgi:PKD repeat protein